MKIRLTPTLKSGVLALFGLASTCKAVDYHAATAQDLQTDLTLAAASSVSNNIYVASGYYLGNFSYNSSSPNSLTILAEPGITNTQITLDSGGTGGAMSISAPATANIIVQGMTFLRNCGNTSIGGLQIAGGNTTILVSGCLFLSPTNSSGVGLQITSGLNATVTNCTAAGNNSAAGISISGIPNNVTVQNCAITANAGGLSVSGGSAVVAVTGSLLANNSGGRIGSSSYGGAFCSGTTVTLFGNTFTSNSGVMFYGYVGAGGATCYGDITLSENNFTGNSMQDDGSGAGSVNGGGAYCQGGNVTLSGNTFTGNSSMNSEFAAAGGGAYCAGNVTLTGNTFTGNSASTHNFVSFGGGVYCDGSGGHAILLSGNTFTSNSTPGGSGSGGGAYVSGGLQTISGNVFQQNTASFLGGGLYAAAPTITLLDNLVANNQAGGGIWVDASASLNMINNTVTGNSSSGNGGGVAFVVTGMVELLNVYNNIIWGNVATASGGDVYLSGTGQKKVFNFNDVDSTYGVWDVAQNNIDFAPKFFDPVNGDYHTQSGSKCIAAGTTNAPMLPATDLDGSPRVINSAVDLGCYEFTTNVFHPADLNGDWVISRAEFNAYAAAWKNAQTWANPPNPISANYMTRAGYLMTNGGAYFNDGSARPLNWKINP